MGSRNCLPGSQAVFRHVFGHGALMKDFDIHMFQQRLATVQGRAPSAQLQASSATESNVKATDASFSRLMQAEANRGSRIAVEKGDTLISMTKRFMRAQQLNPSDADLYKFSMEVARHNRLSNPNLIRVGQVLDFSSLSGSALSSTQPRASESLPPPSGLPPQGLKLVVVGDSIAVGIGGALLKQSGVKPEFSEGRKFLKQVSDQYVVDATGGHSSPQILKKLSANPLVKHADVAILSVGTNDWVNSSVNAYYTPERITSNLQKIRAEVNAKEHVWVLPYDEQAKALVLKVAQEHGDKTLDLGSFQKADRYHPRNYADIAKSLTQSLNTASSLERSAAMSVSQESPASTPIQWVSTQSALMSRPQPLLK